MTNALPQIALNDGVQMPVVGFGVFQIPADETERAVTEALAVGYRSLDTAASYGNEEAVGRAIASSGIPREELFVTTKMWVLEPGGEDDARRAFEASLRRLGLDYLDLYLIHQPFGDCDRRRQLLPRTRSRRLSTRSRRTRSSSALPSSASCASVVCRSSRGDRSPRGGTTCSPIRC